MSVRLALLMATGVLMAMSVTAATPAFADADDFCAKVHNDDRLRPYDASMRPDFVRAFKKLFPRAIGGQSDAMLKAEAVFRCLNGKLVACFKEPGRPCGKIGQVKANAGADAFCRADRQARDVPRAASGYESAFAYSCHDGRAEISGPAWTLDTRGFAKETWTLLDLD